MKKRCGPGPWELGQPAGGGTCSPPTGAPGVGVGVGGRPRQGSRPQGAHSDLGDSWSVQHRHPGLGRVRAQGSSPEGGLPRASRGAGPSVPAGRGAGPGLGLRARKTTFETDADDLRPPRAPGQAPPGGPRRPSPRSEAREWLRALPSRRPGPGPRAPRAPGLPEAPPRPAGGAPTLQSRGGRFPARSGSRAALHLRPPGDFRPRARQVWAGTRGRVPQPDAEPQLGGLGSSRGGRRGAARGGGGCGDAGPEPPARGSATATPTWAGPWGRGSGSAHPIGAREAQAAPPQEAALAHSAPRRFPDAPPRGGAGRRRSPLTLRRRARRRAR